MNKQILIAWLSIAAFTASIVPAAGPPIQGLPRELKMQTYVKHVLAMTGLKNDVRVVVDRGVKGCAYAATVDGQQYIGIDPPCVGALMQKGRYQWRAICVLTHEIGHLLSGHTTNQKLDNPAEESDADEWSGWAMFRLGASLEEAQTFMATTSLGGGATHPGRKVRMASIERGWNKAKAGTGPSLAAASRQGWWGDLMKKPLPWISLASIEAPKK